MRRIHADRRQSRDIVGREQAEPVARSANSQGTHAKAPAEWQLDLLLGHNGGGWLLTSIH
jgi:hypothetical protein